MSVKKFRVDTIASFGSRSEAEERLAACAAVLRAQKQTHRFGVSLTHSKGCFLIELWEYVESQ